MAKSDNGELNNSNLASNNSDPNNSLLQKVTKRVSGLFPSSISKWFGPSDGSQSQSVIRRRDSEDDDDDQLQIQQPPKKRAKSTITTDDFTITNHHYQQTTSTPLLSSRHLQPGPSGYTRHTISSALYDGGDGVQNTVNGDDKSDDSGDSTSGYSSVLAQQHKESSFVSDQKRGMMMMVQPNQTKITNNTPSPDKPQNRSLFSEQNLNPQRSCLSSRRPSFNSSTFGSPTFMDRTLSTKRAVNSPFYGGRTIYGGASAYKRNRIIFPRDEIKNTINIKPVNNETNNDNVSLSKTARRILDTLEHFSSPVIDAKKIPNINRQNTINNKPQRLNPYARDLNKTPTAPNRELIIPTVPDLLKMKQKQRLQTSTEQVRKVAVSSKSILNTEYKIRTLDDNDDTTKPLKHTNKMKKVIADDRVDAVQLPEIQLPITSLPKFDFTLPLPNPNPNPNPAPAVPVIPVVPSASPATKTPEIIIKPVIPNVRINSVQFKFAEPIVVTSNDPKIKSIKQFKFCEPLNATIKSNKIASFKAVESSTAPRKKEQKNNGQNEFSLQPPEKLVEGSVMDILGKKPDNLMDKFKAGVGTWECSSCMVRNIPTATRCVACETLKEPVKKIPNKTANNFGNQFKMTAEKWECGVCMVRNDVSELKCVACTTPKPCKLITAPLTPPNNVSGFGDKFKPPSNTWECGACMIRNKSDAVKCAACETPKPGAVKEQIVGLVIPVTPATPGCGGFTDLIKKQQTNWECPSCMVRNPPEKKTCACCEGPKPGEKQEFKFGTSTTQQFKFGIDKSGTSTSTPTTTFSFGVDAAATSITSTPTTTFSFGVPAAAKPSTGFTFGVQKPPEVTPTTIVASTPPNTKTENAATTTPNFSFGLPPPPPNPTNIVLNGDPKKLFSFGTQSTTITSSTNSATKATSSIFNPVTASTSSTTKTTSVTTAILTPSESNSAVSSTSVTTTTIASTTFSFGATQKSDENKKTPQFNFGSSSSLPFNPVFGQQKSIAQNTEGFNTTAFSFKTQNNNNNNNNSINNKTEVMKPFSFTTASDAPKSKFPEFTFNPLTTTTAAAAASTTTSSASTAAAAATSVPLSKAPVINFGANDPQQKPPNNMFSFGANKTEKVTPNFGSGSMFGQQTLQTPQNGGFNFGASNVQTPNFNFGAGTTQTAASATNPTVFGFGSSQAGSGSGPSASAPVTAAPPSATPGLFTFGQQQQPPTTAFTADVKPNFNFTGGTPIPSFTGQGGAPSATMPQRKIRKAVRRTQPR